MEGAPIGEIGETMGNYPALHEVTMYQARCTNCGHIETEYGDFNAWGDPDTPRHDVVENLDWFEVFKDGAAEMLLCPDCQHCEVCGSPRAYGIDDHLVCDEHEDHDFTQGGTDGT